MKSEATPGSSPGAGAAIAIEAHPRASGGEQFIQRHRARRRYRLRQLAVHACRQDPQCISVDVDEVDVLPHGGSKPSPRLGAKATRIGSPILDIACKWPTLGFEHLHEGLQQQRFDRVQLLASHTSQSGRSLIGSPAAIRRSRSLWRSLHSRMSSSYRSLMAPYPSTMPMSGAAGFFMPTIL
jgi:hypothetical protein